jgi:hypothetical protein
VYFVCSRHAAKQFVKDNHILVLTLFWGLCFVSIVNTGARTLTAVEIVSLLLTLKLLVKIKWIGRKTFSIPVAIVGLILTSTIQGHAAYYGKVQMQNYQKCIEEYIANDDGVFRKTIVAKPSYVMPYVLNWSTGMSSGVLSLYMQKVYNQPGKKPLPLIDKEYDLLASGEMFTAKNAFPGGSGFYAVPQGSGYWAKYDSIDANTLHLQFNFQRVNFHTRGASFCLGIKFVLTPDSYSRRELIDSISIIDTRWGKFYFIAKPSLMDVESINRTNSDN